MDISARRKRSDLPFLTRRIRPQDQLPASTPAPNQTPPPPVTGLNLVTPPAGATGVSASGLSLGNRPTTPPARPASAAAPAQAPAQAPAPSAGLSLGRTPAAAGAGLSLGTPPVEAITRHSAPSLGTPVIPERIQPFAAPSAGEVHELTASRPMVRLNARQSAIGSLSLIGSGTIVWESRTGITGSATQNGTTLGRYVPTRGNRPLVEFDAGRGLIALRHVAQLRRVLFICTPNTALSIQLYDGISLALPALGAAQRNILLITRVGNLLELRSDPAPSDLSDAPIWGAFGFTMSVPLPPSPGAN